MHYFYFYNYEKCLMRENVYLRIMHVMYAIFQVAKWNKQDSTNRKLLCTARPNWMSLSLTFFKKVCTNYLLHLNLKNA